MVFPRSAISTTWFKPNLDSSHLGVYSANEENLTLNNDNLCTYLNLGDFIPLQNNSHELFHSPLSTSILVSLCWIFGILGWNTIPSYTELQIINKTFERLVESRDTTGRFFHCLHRSNCSNSKIKYQG